MGILMFIKIFVIITLFAIVLGEQDCNHDRFNAPLHYVESTAPVIKSQPRSEEPSRKNIHTDVL